MNNERQFAYMKKWKSGYTIAIIYSFGAYYIARLMENGDRGFVYTIRRYKTLSGAEKYLLTRVNGGDENKGTEPDISYGTEAFIRTGSYWKAGK